MSILLIASSRNTPNPEQGSHTEPSEAFSNGFATMVYLGRPSRGCQLCKKRKIKVRFFLRNPCPKRLPCTTAFLICAQCSVTKLDRRARNAKTANACAPATSTNLIWSCAIRLTPSGGRSSGQNRKGAMSTNRKCQNSPPPQGTMSAKKSCSNRLLSTSSYPEPSPKLPRSLPFVPSSTSSSSFHFIPMASGDSWSACCHCILPLAMTPCCPSPPPPSLSPSPPGHPGGEQTLSWAAACSEKPCEWLPQPFKIPSLPLKMRL